MAWETRTTRLIISDALNDRGEPALRDMLISINERRRKAKADYLEWTRGGRLDQCLIDSQTALYEGLMQDSHNINMWAKRTETDLKALTLKETAQFPSMMSSLGYYARWREYYILLELAQAAWGMYESGMYKQIPEFAQALTTVRNSDEWKMAERERGEARLARGYWQTDAILASKRAREKARHSSLSEEAKDERNRLLREKRALLKASRNNRDALYDELTSQQAAE